MKTRTKFLSLVFGTTIATSAIIAPTIALSSCSENNDRGTGNNNQNGNGNNTTNFFDPPTTPQHVEPLQQKVISATSEADAKAQLNAYFQANATLDRLNSDLISWYKKQNQNFIVKATEFTKDKSVKIKFYQKQQNSTNSEDIWITETENVPVIPVLVLKTTQNNKKIYNVFWALPGFADKAFIIAEQNQIRNPNPIPGKEDFLFNTKQEAETALKNQYPQNNNPNSFVVYERHYEKIKKQDGTIEESDGWSAKFVTIKNQTIVENDSSYLMPTDSMNITVEISI